jgi:alpha-L-fucosidase
MTMNDHWGFNAHDTDFKSVNELLRTLVDVVSKGGNFLLNVGPTAEGEIPAPCLERLAGIGKWMRTNGDAIHGTQASPIGAPAWGRVTLKEAGDDTRVFLHVFDWPRDGALVLAGLGNEVRSAHLLAAPDREIAVDARDGTVRVSLPAKAPDADVSVIELVLKGAPLVYLPPRIDADADIFVNPTEVRLVPSSETLDVRYTLDGSEPTVHSPSSSGPIRLTETTTITARSFDGAHAVAKSVRRTLARVTPEPAIANEGWTAGLVYLTSLGDRTSVEDSPGISITNDETMAQVEEQLQEKTCATVGIPKEDRRREHLMLTFM